MGKTILASSLDNYIRLNNAYQTDNPYVTFTVNAATLGDMTLSIADADNDDGYKKEIHGYANAPLTSSSFNTSSGVMILNLLECLKKNPIFYSLSLQSSNTLKAYIDSSIRYEIKSTSSNLLIGGTYQSYKAQSPNKMVVMLQNAENNITLEKYNNDSVISFNVTSPFEYTSFKLPIQFNMTAYQVYDSKTSMVTVPFSEMTILPTTLKKFQSVDYSQFYDTEKPHFLTNNEKRQYNYGETIGLSILCDNTPTFKKNFYTQSGMFLETQTTVQYTEQNGIRCDVYDTFDLISVENRYAHQVGYIDFIAVINGNDSYAVRYHVKPTCRSNQEIFFINELGGIDSFNFTNARNDEYSIDSQSTYFINPINGYGDTYEMQYVKQKTAQHTITLVSNYIDSNTAKWLNELVKSKYTYLYLGTDNPKYKIIVVDSLDINTTTTDDIFQVELEYHISDDEMSI